MIESDQESFEDFGRELYDDSDIEDSTENFHQAQIMKDQLLSENHIAELQNRDIQQKFDHLLVKEKELIKHKKRLKKSQEQFEYQVKQIKKKISQDRKNLDQKKKEFRQEEQ